MVISSPEPAQKDAKMVLCPRCGLPCSLLALKRPGAYRLVDPDGHGHAAVCMASIEPAPAPMRYRRWSYARSHSLRPRTAPATPSPAACKPPRRAIGRARCAIIASTQPRS